MNDLTALIQKCKDSDPSAQKELYKLFNKKVRKICYRYCKNKADHEDVMQEVFITVFNKISTFAGSGCFEGWIRKIAVNKSLKTQETKSLFRLEKLDPNLLFCSDQFSTLYTFDLLAIINNMPSGYQKIFTLYAIEGYSHKEISELLKISEGTSKSQLFHARSTLKTMLVR